MLLLHFNVERRDRRKREYIFIEGNHHTILKVLNPIIDQNKTSISVTSEVEVSSMYIPNQCNHTYLCILRCGQVPVRIHVSGDRLQYVVLSVLFSLSSLASLGNSTARTLSPYTNI